MQTSWIVKGTSDMKISKARVRYIDSFPWTSCSKKQPQKPLDNFCLMDKSPNGQMEDAKGIELGIFQT